MTLKPFFTYYGGKHRIARRYPQPQHDTIIEPFAGSAGYACHFPERKVFLVDLDPIIVGVWRYLIAAPEAEILALPDVGPDGVDVLSVPQEAKWLIGFWLNKGSASPRKTPSAWMRGGTRPKSYWGSSIRQRIASQQSEIRHWQVFEGRYENIPDTRATWFVDPPYQIAGSHYRKGAKGIDFRALGAWCQSRDGQTIVCENQGANWLPFAPFLDARANPSSTGGKVSKEAIWYRET